VNRLGESSQEISVVVSLINNIALRTNLLSINASLEMARVGDESQGFVVVVEEIGNLAAQSVQATTEIQKILENILLGTNDVVQAMSIGSTQVVEGANLVKNAKLSLEQIVDLSRQIDQLVQSISSATVSQAQTSAAVAILVKEIAKVSERTSDSSGIVSSSLQKTLEIAQQLQKSVSVFKTGEQNLSKDL
jgi:methyl-accepting chemotaxis protein